MNILKLMGQQPCVSANLSPHVEQRHGETWKVALEIGFLSEKVGSRPYPSSHRYFARWGCQALWLICPLLRWCLYWANQHGRQYTVTLSAETHSACGVVDTEVGRAASFAFTDSRTPKQQWQLSKIVLPYQLEWVKATQMGNSIKHLQSVRHSCLFCDQRKVTRNRHRACHSLSALRTLVRTAGRLCGHFAQECDT